MRSVLLVLVALLVAGCSAAPPASPTLPSSPSQARLPASLVLPHCVADCFESSVAQDRHGWLLATTGFGDALARSTDNGTTWAKLGAMPLPPGSPSGAMGDDSWVAAGPDGRLYYVTPLFAQTSPLLSIQVAATSNAGHSWDSNVLVGLPGQGHQDIAATDRPWLGFGANGTLYLTYNNLATGIWLSVSRDGGQAFNQFLPITTPLGSAGPAAASPVISDASGAIYLAFNGAAPSPAPGSGLQVAKSTDGLTWSFTKVAADGNWFPHLAYADGVLALAWTSSLDATVKVSISKDHGATWNAPVQWDRSLSGASPWATWSHGRLAIAWFTAQSGANWTLKLGVGDEAGQSVLTQDVAGLAGGTQKAGQPNTDFATLITLQDGRLGLLWSDHADETLRFRAVAA